MRCIFDGPVDEAAMLTIAADLAGKLTVGDVVALHGDLGAGKTTFARALVRALVADAALEVPSPTFAIRQDYAGADGPVVHFDLYRIQGIHEVEDVGFTESLSAAVTLIEWPERAGDLLPSDRIDIILGDGPSADCRALSIRCGESAYARLKGLALSR